MTVALFCLEFCGGDTPPLHGLTEFILTGAKLAGYSLL
jgi:hypothetical protein